MGLFNNNHLYFEPLDNHVEDDEESGPTKKQAKVLDMVLMGLNVFLTGGAGVGKSYVIDLIRQCTDKNIALVAPTGVAAQNICGVTIHSLFGFRDSLFEPKRSYVSSDEQVDVLRAMDILLVDEISMCRIDLFMAMDYALRKIMNTPHLPFGGKQVIVVGDFLQLPPVISKPLEYSYLRNNYGGIYAFESDSWKECNFTTVILDEVHRQKGDLEFINQLNALRFGEIDQQIFPGGISEIDVIEAINSRVYIGQPFKQATILCATNTRVEAINRARDEALGGHPVKFIGKVEGKVNLDDMPVSLELEFRIGSRVMLRCNGCSIESVKFVNGDVGIVECYDEQNRSVKVKLDRGPTVTVQQNIWPEEKYTLGADGKTLTKETIGKFSQIALVLSTAMSTHKCQGLSLDCVHIDLGARMFCNAQLYTALSRCREVTTLSLSREIYPSDVMYDSSVKEFYRGLGCEFEIYKENDNSTEPDKLWKDCETAVCDDESETDGSLPDF